LARRLDDRQPSTVGPTRQLVPCVDDSANTFYTVRIPLSPPCVLHLTFDIHALFHYMRLDDLFDLFRLCTSSPCSLREPVRLTFKRQLWCFQAGATPDAYGTSTRSLCLLAHSQQNVNEPRRGESNGWRGRIEMDECVQFSWTISVRCSTQSSRRRCTVYYMRQQSADDSGLL